VDATGGLKLRHSQRADYARVLAVIDDWWDGRPMSSRLSHVFFSHFAPTSFVLETDTELLGFLLGFLSQTRTDEAHVHLVGVHPEFRRLGLGRRLYERFFAAAGMHGRSWVSSIDAPSNGPSIAFHAAMGFLPEPGNGVVDGVPVRLDYAGDRGHRVVFHRRETPGVWPAAPKMCIGAPAPCRIMPPGDVVEPARRPSVQHVRLDQIRLAGLVGLQAGGDHHHLTALREAAGEDEVVGVAHDVLEAAAVHSQQGSDAPAEGELIDHALAGAHGDDRLSW
jgi:GNAT superfamily N-acetyltransferase